MNLNCKQLLFFYLFCLTLFIICTSFIIDKTYLKLKQPKSNGSLYQKTIYYLKSPPSKYNMIYLGDSRAYCAFHPDLMDQTLERKSYNLSHFSNWLPVQYNQLIDIVNNIPEKTTVIWSIGHQNFVSSHINAVYPIKIQSYIELFLAGKNFKNLINTYIAFSSFFNVLDRRKSIIERIDIILKNNVDFKNEPEINFHSLESFETSNNQQNVLKGRVKKYLDKNGNLLSTAYSKLNGAYMRVENNKKYYRDMQKKSGLGLIYKNPKIDTIEIKLFNRMLSIFKEKKVNLIINIMEEAPHSYFSYEDKVLFRNYIKNSILPLIINNGFKYIYINFDDLKQHHYFDHNHLNYEGVKLFTKLFSSEIKKIGL